MGETSAALTEMAEVASLRAQAEGLRAQLAGASARESELEHAVGVAEQRLGEEREDVRILEELTFTRVWAALKGDRASHLERERAEAQVAELEHANATYRLDGARTESARLRRRLTELGDLDSRWQRALAAREAEVLAAADADRAKADELTAVVAQLAARDAETVELREALAAAGAAVRALEAARHSLGSASSWATWDTFGGGGLFTDAMKYQRLDTAFGQIQAADAALRFLSTELADVRLPRVGELGVGSLARTFDVWFDNIFSDMAARSRIAGAGQQVDRAGFEVTRVIHVLEQRFGDALAEIDRLHAAREGLLGA